MLQLVERLGVELLVVQGADGVDGARHLAAEVAQVAVRGSDFRYHCVHRLSFLC